jgi:1-acyl-sn-glycerol-3-phosphate acyltransferase
LSALGYIELRQICFLRVFMSKPSIHSSDASLSIQTNRQMRKIYRSSRLVMAVGQAFYAGVVSGALFKPNQPHHPRVVLKVCSQVCKALAIDVKIHGEMPTNHALWVSNHVSWTDIAVIGSAAPVFFISKAEVASWPVIGRLVKAGGTVFIQRGSGDVHDVTAQIAGFLRQKFPILFFPEGTTTDGRSVRRLHSNLLRAAVDTGTPIQPIVLCYEGPDGRLDTVMPYVGSITFGAHLQHVLARSKVKAHILPLAAICVDGHTVHTLTDELLRIMREGLAELQAQVLVP